MNTAALIARLQSQCPGFKFVGGAMDLSESALLSTTYPAVFVIPVGETADPNQLYGGHRQTLHQQWGILIALKTMRTTAADQSGELQTLRQQTRTALLGWAPDPDSDPLEFASGSLLGIDAGMLLWQDDYTTTQTITGA